MPKAPADPGVGPDVLERLPAPVAVVEAPGVIVWANESFWNLAPRSREDPRPDFLGSLSPDDPAPPALREALERTLRPAAGPGHLTIELLSPHRTMEIDLEPLDNGGTRPARAVVLVRDVSRQAVEREQAILFRASYLTTSNPIEITDRRGVLVDVNPAFERVYGYSRAECIGRKPNLVRGRSTPPEVYDQMWRDLLDPARGYWSGELANRDRKGRERPVFLTITAIRNPSGETTHYLGVAIDLAEQKAWERAAEHQDKLASIGQLAAGVAHEINTPLANVMLIAESIHRRSTDPWVKSRSETISGQVELAGTIVRGLLDFARRSEPQIGPVDLVDVARDSLAFLKGKQSADVEFVERYPEGPVPVLADRAQLVQVLTNLLNNACEAMEGNGRVSVEVRRHDRDAQIEIVDTGPGIAEVALPHIFEPFFTTKPEGKGTGLGLAICHGIVQAHHGSISARNVAGAGAAFLVTLPASATPAPEPKGSK